jgi:ribosomal protein S14
MMFLSENRKAASAPARERYAANLNTLVLKLLPARSFSSAISTTRAETRCARTATTARFRPGFIYVQRSTVKIGAIQLRDCGLSRLCFRHFDECEAARLARIPVGDNIHALHAAVGSERSVKIVLRSLIAEVSDKYICHV